MSVLVNETNVRTGERAYGRRGLYKTVTVACVTALAKSLDVGCGRDLGCGLEIPILVSSKLGQ